VWGDSSNKRTGSGEKRWLRSFVDEMLIWSCSNELLRNPVKSQRRFRRVGNPASIGLRVASGFVHRFFFPGVLNNGPGPIAI